MIILQNLQNNINIVNLLQIQMSQISTDPFRFLNIKKKRQSNRQKLQAKLSTNKNEFSQQSIRCMLPSFSSQNSLEDNEKRRIDKQYNPFKYFNPQIQEYLTKLAKLKIANAPMINLNNFRQNVVEDNNENIKNQSRFEQTSKIQINCNEMMTFAKGIQAEMLPQAMRDTRFLNNFHKPGLKKSGSVKMMEKMQQQQGKKTVQIVTKNEGISPWQLPENLTQPQQLKQCQICSRKFNPESYSKHIRVCDKVFFQKRKPFNSKSKSKDKKQ